MPLVEDVAFRGIHVRGLEGFRPDIGTRGTILAVAQLETDEDLALALRPLQHRRSLQVLPVLHLDLLQHPPVDLQPLVDDSGNPVAVEEGGVVELVEAGQGQRDEFQLGLDCGRAGVGEGGGEEKEYNQDHRL